MTDLNALQRWLRYLGAAMTAASVIMTFSFGMMLPQGWLQGLTLGGFLGCVSFGSAYLLPFLPYLWSKKAYVSFGLGLIAVGLFGATDITTNFGFSGGQRAISAQVAGVQDVRFDDQRTVVEDNAKLVAFLEKRIGEIELSAMWRADKTPAAYAAEIAVADEAIRQEANRGGCGPKCLQLKADKAELEANQALAISHAEAVEKLAAAKRAHAEITTTAATVDKGFSGSEAQANIIASAFSFSPDPTSQQRFTADTVVNLMLALAATIGPMLVNYFGWWGFSWTAPASPAVRRETATDTAVADLRSTSAAMSALMPDKAVQQLREVRAICA